MDEMGIGELAAKTGLTTSALRYYETEGLLMPVRREGQRRRYSQQAIARVSAIQLAQRAGFTIAEVRALLDATTGTASADWHAMASRKVRELRAQIERLNAMVRLLEGGLACSSLDLEACDLLPPNSTL